MILAHCFVFHRSPVHLEPINKQSDQDKTPKKPTSKHSNDSPDRIIVVRGELAAICATEAYISEQVRLIMARDSVPICLWPLLPHLPPLTPSPQPHSATLAASSAASTNSPGTSLDLPTLNRLALCVALMFWNPSTWNKLISYVSFGSTAPRSASAITVAARSSLQAVDRRRTKSVDRVDGTTAVRHPSDPSVESSAVASDTTTSTIEHASLPPPETRSMAEIDPETEGETASLEQSGEKFGQLNHEPHVIESCYESHLSVPNDNTSKVGALGQVDEKGKEATQLDSKKANDLSGTPLSNTRKLSLMQFSLMRSILWPLPRFCLLTSPPPFCNQSSIRHEN